MLCLKHLSFYILPTSLCTLAIFVFLPLPPFLIPSACNATPPATIQHHLPFPLVPTATMLPTPLLLLLPVSTPPHMPTTTAAFATLSPRVLTPMPHAFPSFLFALVSLCLRLATLSALPIPTSSSLLHNVH